MNPLPGCDATECRSQPSVREAADFLVKHHREPVFVEYRRRCLADWRDRFGERFAGAVEAEVRARWGRR